jgi:RND family efflux transporter MFP subunit
MVLAAVLAAGCDHGPPAAPPAKTVQVIVTQPITYDVTDYQDFTGRLDAFRTVDIRSRVTGYIHDAPFKEGDLVHEGDLLFQIDPRPYAADLNQAKANLTLAEADRNLQEKIVARARKLISGRNISQEEFDQDVAASEKAQATIGAMQAARDRSQLYVDYTRVTAPLTGRISRRFVDPGNLVNADNTILTTLVAESPMYAYFDVDERTYLDLIESASPSQTAWLAGLQFPVLMRLANEEDFVHSGVINFIDNRVIATTGTVRMRGVFENTKGNLKSGLFVRIRLPIGKPYPALLIPDEALQSDQGRKYVWVVNKENQVEYRPVKLGQAITGLRVIQAAEKGKEGKEGLSKDDRIIISGMQRVRPGVQVQVKAQDPPKPPESPLKQSVVRSP